MSGQALRWNDQQLLPSDFAHVLHTLADFHQPRLGCFPAIDSIVRRTKLSRETVKRRLKVLQKLGLISKTTAYKAGRRATTYTLHFQVIVTAPTSLKAFREWFRQREGKEADYEARLALAVSRADRAQVIMSRADGVFK